MNMGNMEGFFGKHGKYGRIFKNMGENMEKMENMRNMGNMGKLGALGLAHQRCRRHSGSDVAHPTEKQSVYPTVSKVHEHTLPYRKVGNS